MSCSPKAVKWLWTPEKFIVIACAEFYCHQIAAEFSLNFAQCITDLVMLIQTSLLLVFVLRLRVFVQPRNSKNEQTDMSVQPTGKWIERISQSERALP